MAHYVVSWDGSLTHATKVADPSDIDATIEAEQALGRTIDAVVDENDTLTITYAQVAWLVQKLGGAGTADGRTVLEYANPGRA